MQVVAADIGGTHARFAVAEVEAGEVIRLGDAVTLNTADHADFEAAWRAFAAGVARPAPKATAIAFAAPITGDVVRLTNSHWVIRPALIPELLGAETWTIVNDFVAVGHAVAQLPPGCFDHLCGPDEPLPPLGVTTVCGPGTGLGVAQVYRTAERYHVLATEGGHIAYAPLDRTEEVIVERLRERFDRVSAERVCAGPGIVPIYETLAELEGRAAPLADDRTIWTAAAHGRDALAVAAADRFCAALGAVAGDLALAHGANGVVLSGAIAARLKERLAGSGFHRRFIAKGRFESTMGRLPIKLINHPQPGLFGAAAAFAMEHM